MFEDVIIKINELDFKNEFIIDEILGRSYTYCEFFSQALLVADFIENSVVGDSVIAVKENSYELALLYFSVMLTTKRILVVDPQKGKDEIKTIVDELDKTSIFLDGKSEWSDAIKHEILNLPELREPDIDLIEIKQKVLDKLQRRNNDIPFLVTYTSGTSGVTKGVEHTLDSLFLSALALDTKVQKRRGTFIHVMPMTYMAGILNSLIYPFIVGARIVIVKRFSIASARNFWNVVIKYGVNLFWLSPAMLMMIDQMDRKSDGEIYCRQNKLTFLIGTAPLTNEMRTKFNSRYGVKVFASYGLSETLFVSVETKESLEKSDKNSVGEFLPGVEYYKTEFEELLINVPWMYRGYTNENTKEYFEENYYKSGDLAEIKDGCLYITGRSKDLIIKGGMNISPVLIENCIYKEQRILENVVIGVKDCSGEEKVCCVYTLSDEVENQTALESKLKKLVLNELGKNYSLDYLWQIDAIPRNINGKIDKNKLKQMWETKNGKQNTDYGCYS
jgi:AMP-dependent synthetase/ligase